MVCATEPEGSGPRLSFISLFFERDFLLGLTILWIWQGQACDGNGSFIGLWCNDYNMDL